MVIPVEAPKLIPLYRFLFRCIGRCSHEQRHRSKEEFAGRLCYLHGWSRYRVPGIQGLH
jgi:hypothetical protein